MAIEYNSLQILKYRKYYNRFYELVLPTIFDEATKFILKSFGDYFKIYDKDVIDTEEFYQYFMLNKCRKLSDEDKATYRIFIRNIKQDPPEAVKNTFLSRVADERLANAISNSVFKFNDGKEIMLAEEVAKACEDYATVSTAFTKEDYITTPLSELISREENEEGIKWRLPCLNRCMKPLVAGDFGIIAARPDAGKSTFICSELTKMAAQLPNDRNAIFINNEGNGDQLVLRMRMAALGCSLQELIKKYHTGTVDEEYAKAIGRVDKIRIINAHDMNLGQIERIMDKHKAAICVYDMLDNVPFYVSNTGDKSCDRLEALYKRARVLQTKHECIGLATSQISAEGDGLKFPSQSALKDSKTGKQGACDFILTIGRSDDMQLDSLRYINTPKNKKKRDGVKGQCRQEVMFKPEIARYEEYED